MKSKFGRLVCDRTEGALRISNGYWEVEHSLDRGGCITSIRFLEGSNSNILVAPCVSDVGVAPYVKGLDRSPEGRKRECEFYADINSRHAELAVRAETPESVAFTVSGELTNGRGEGICRFSHEYEYHRGFLKRTQTYAFDQDVYLMMLNLARFRFRPELNRYCYRKYTLRNPYCPEDRWGAVEAGPGRRDLVQDFNVPLYLCAYREGVEGIEFFPGSEIGAWAIEKDAGRHTLAALSDPPCVEMEIAPYVGRRPSLKFSGEYVFRSYLGLPNVRERINRDVYRRVSFNGRPWPTDEEIVTLRECGVRHMRLHDDSPKPDGRWWRDGSFPPYGPEDLGEMKRVIAAARRNDIQTLFYISPVEYHPESQGFRENAASWGRVVDSQGGLFDNWYGYLMCLRSGWKDFLIQYIRKVYETYGFDGVYFDWTVVLGCTNARHCEQEHTNIDGLIELIETTRDVVGETGLITVHIWNWMPCMAIENYVDFVGTSERGVIFDGNGDVTTPYLKFVPNTFRGFAPSFFDEKEARQVVARTLVHGLGVGIGFRDAMDHPRGAIVMDMYKAAKDIHTQDYRFADCRSGMVRIRDNGNVRGAIYWNQKEAIVILANTQTDGQEAFSWGLDLTGLDLQRAEGYVIENRRTGARENAGRERLLSSDLCGCLGGFAYEIFRITPLGECKEQAADCQSP